MHLSTERYFSPPKDGVPLICAHSRSLPVLLWKTFGLSSSLSVLTYRCLSTSYFHVFVFHCMCTLERPNCADCSGGSIPQSLFNHTSDSPSYCLFQFPLIFFPHRLHYSHRALCLSVSTCQSLSSLLSNKTPAVVVT